MLTIMAKNGKGFLGVPYLTKTDYKELRPQVKYGELLCTNNPSKPNSKALEAPIESFKQNLYKPAAKMNAFKMFPKNVKCWMEIFYIRYCIQFEKVDSYQTEVKYNKNEKGEIEEIFIQVSRADDITSQFKLFTIKAYLNTHTVTVQGNHFSDWCEQEFPHLKAVVNEQTNEETSTKEVVETINEEPEDSETHLKEIVPPVEKVTFETMDCSFRKKIDDIASSIKDVYVTLHKLETQYCDILVSERKLSDLENRVSAMDAQTETERKTINNKLDNMEGKISVLIESDKRHIDTVTQTEKRLKEVETKYENMENKLSKLTKNEKSQEDYIYIEQKLKIKEQENLELKEKCRALEMELNSLKEIQITRKEPKTISQENIQKEKEGQSSNMLTTRNITQVSKQKNTVLMIFDSHGRNIDCKKLYRNQNIQKVVLPEGKKTIAGAKQYIEENYRTMDMYSHIIIAVGGNDVDTKANMDEILLKMGSLVNIIVSLLAEVNIHILQAIPRLDNALYNKKLMRYNGGLYSLESDKVSIIPVTEIRERDSEMFQNDNVHLSHSGNLALIHDLKKHLNPVLGLPPYETYRSNYAYTGYHKDDYKRSPHRSPNVRGSERRRSQPAPEGQYSLRDQMYELLKKMT